MKRDTLYDNEKKAAAAFSKQSVLFDELYAQNTIIHYKRQRVRSHVANYLNPGSSILELNCGTGEDAIWFANKGHSIHATDASAGMIEMINKKKSALEAGAKISTERCSFTQLEHLENRGPYDFIFSNFAGLNCTGELKKVLQSLSPLLHPGSVVTLVILPEFCLWETLLLFTGKFKTAFRRFFSRNGVKAHVEGLDFTCWYYNPSFVIKTLASEFNLLSIEGLCTFVPPSYIEHFAENHPGWYQWLKKKEDRYKLAWPWRTIGDYYIISLQKKTIDSNRF